jgi:hypothetical protein
MHAVAQLAHVLDANDGVEFAAVIEPDPQYEKIWMRARRDLRPDTFRRLIAGGGHYFGSESKGQRCLAYAARSMQQKRAGQSPGSQLLAQAAEYRSMTDKALGLFGRGNALKRIGER